MPYIRGEGGTWILEGVTPADIGAEPAGAEQRAVAYVDQRINTLFIPTSAADVGAIPVADRGVAFGVASLNQNGQIPTVELPGIEALGGIPLSQKAQPLGVPSLGSDGKIPITQITQALLDRITTLETQMAGLLNVQPVASNELVSNTGFTSGVSPWYGVVGDEQLSTAQISGKSGNVLQVGGRVDATRGAAIDVAFSKNNSVLRVQYWSRSASGGTTLRCKAKLTFDDGTSTTITLGSSGLSTAPTLTDFISPVISWTKTLTKFTIFLDTSGGTSTIYLDDFSVTEVTEVYSYSFSSGISNAWMMAGQQISLVQDGGVQVARNGGNYSSLEKHQQNGIVPLQAGTYRLICNCRLDAASTIFRMYWNEHTTYKDITELTYVDVGYDFVLSAAISSAKFGVIANGPATTAGCLIRSFRIVKFP